jgi:hypothetical protein
MTLYDNTWIIHSKLIVVFVIHTNTLLLQHYCSSKYRGTDPRETPAEFNLL